MSDTPDRSSTPKNETAAPRILVESATARYSSTIDLAGMSLIIGTGTVENGPKVMVPFVECEIGGTFGTEDEKKTDSVLITLENAAFLIESFTNELARLMPAYSSFSAGEIKPLTERVDYALDCVRRTGENLSIITDALSKSRAETIAHRNPDI